jgi:pyruvate dehydrogenase E2 component (dihydrolipoamide acetyltransferase)
VRATPLVRNLARKHGVDLAQVRGTGAQGLVTRADLDAYLRGRPGAAGVAPAQAAQPAAGAPQEPGLLAEALEVPLSVHQRAVARAVTAAKTQVPHYYLKVRIGADRLQAWRQANLRPDGQKVAVDAVLVWACARALLRHPRLNGTMSGERLRLEPQVHLGVAVAVGEELHVPVIRQAQLKDIASIDRELATLVEKARGGRLVAADISAGSFTLTNLGMYPVEEFAAVLNAPQVAIAAAGRIGRELNGAQGAAFLAEIKRILEEEL